MSEESVRRDERCGRVLRARRDGGREERNAKQCKEKILFISRLTVNGNWRTG